MRSREKLTPEEKVALALDLIKRERTLDEIRAYYRVSHTTAYKVRNAFLEGGKAALFNERGNRHDGDLENRVRAIETLIHRRLAAPTHKPARAAQRAAMNNGRQEARKRQG